MNGVKGPSIMSALDGFDCIWGFPLDYMHTILLGVTHQLWTYWRSHHLDPTAHRIINNRLLNIKPPSEIHRSPRALNKNNKWKATEWRSWLLYYSIPCMTDILRQELLDSYISN